MKKIQKVSSYIHALLTAMLITWPILWYLSWTGHLIEGIGSSLEIKTSYGLIDGSNPDLPLLSRSLCMLGAMLGVLPFFLGLWVVRQLFKNYKKGEIFSVKNIHAFKRIGWLFLMNGFLFEPLSHMIQILGATLSNPSGQREVILAFGTLNIESILGGCAIFILSWVMQEAYRLHEEHLLTI